MALRGDTVWPYVVFKDRDGVLSDPDSVTFALYDEAEKEIIPATPLDSSYRYDVGSYEYPLVCPKLASGKTKAIFEFVGTVDTHPEVFRGSISITFLP